MTIGPVVGGALGAAGGIEVALTANALTFLAVAGAAAALRARRPPSRSAAADEHGGGRSILTADPTLRLVMVVTFLTLLIMTGVATAEVFFVRDDLGGGDLGYGLAIAAWTLGMAAGAMFVSKRIGAHALAASAMLMIALQGAGLALPTLILSLPLLMVAYVIGGVGHGTKNVLVRTLIHDRTPPRAHGRAGAAYNALRNGAELAALALGAVLVETVGARGTLAIQGGLPILIALAALLAMRARLQDTDGLPERLPDVEESERAVPTAPVRGEMP
jgi:Na+/melibiose symporter-like transporter